MVDPNLFQLMTEQVKDYAVFLLDPAGNILSWNLGAQVIKGYTPEEIIGKHFSIFYPPEALARRWPEHELREAAREGRFEDEGYRVRKDGSRFWANVIITALRDADGKLLAYSKITRDLTERRSHEETLRQSEERFRLLVDGVLDYAIFMLDPEGLVTSWNNGAERITGYARSDMLGKHFASLFRAEDIQAGKPWQELVDARQNGRVEAQGWRVRKDGTNFWARVVLTPLYDAAGHLRGYAKVTQDLSTQRHLQELESTTKRLNEFIAVLAHEIRNPLAPIRTALSLMSQGGADEQLKDRSRQIIERQTARLSKIADDMLDITRITRGELVTERSRVDISELLDRSVEAASPLIQARQHRLNLVRPAEPLFVIGDMHRLTQVFANLLNNAARYTAPGGTITMRAFWDEGRVVVSVRDTGRGIRPELMPVIFQMFVQGRPPHERPGEGLGVGLALARNIVEVHGGTIEARSEGEGKGTEVIVRLPAVAREEDGGPKAASRTLAAAGEFSKRVLIVDDNADAAVTLDMLLKLLGHKTRVAHDGGEALDAFDDFAPEVVLLDIGLPGLSGYEVARRLRLRRASGFLLIALTGWGQAEDRQQAREAGFDLHLVKPVDAKQLQAILTAHEPPSMAP
jgi:PAS domain S-box-containing protein